MGVYDSVPYRPCFIDCESQLLEKGEGERQEGSVIILGRPKCYLVGCVSSGKSGPM